MSDTAIGVVLIVLWFLGNGFLSIYRRGNAEYNSWYKEQDYSDDDKQMVAVVRLSLYFGIPFLILNTLVLK